MPYCHLHGSWDYTLQCPSCVGPPTYTIATGTNQSKDPMEGYRTSGDEPKPVRMPSNLLPPTIQTKLAQRLSNAYDIIETLLFYTKGIPEAEVTRLRRVCDEYQADLRKILPSA